MSDHGRNARKTFGALIYLKDGNLPQTEGLLLDFHRRWSPIPLVSEGTTSDLVYFRSEHLHFAIEHRKALVPESLTNSLLKYRPDRESFEKILAKHTSHLAISASLDTGCLLDLACVFTKFIVSTLSTTNSIAVSWLGGPVVCAAQEFVALSEELFAQGCAPLLLWIHAEWNSDAHIIHSKGMLQFHIPEVLIAGQSEFSQKMAEYLLDVAYYLLTMDKEIVDGETIDGPNCTFRIEYVNGNEPGKRTLMLIPVRPS